ncbi:MAG TPA: hypothetical protein VH301_08440 [Usitatibacter sp.]|jgi:hypothetical protein|nr:hypothetical protein [Usitatibacter sp.]
MSISETPRQPERKLRSLGWQGQLDQATRPEAVLAVARDYLAQISPEEVAQLPEDCRPGRLVDAEDVADYAFELGRRQSSPDAPEIMHKLSAFFGDASNRLSQILAESQDAAS